MTPVLAHVLATAQLLLARAIAAEVSRTALPVLLQLPTATPVGAAHQTRRASTVVAWLRAAVGPTIQDPGTHPIAREGLEPTPPNVLDGAAVAPGVDELGAGRARAGVAEEEAAVAASVPQGAIADLSAGMGEDPRVGGGVLGFATEAEVELGDGGLGVVDAALGAVPEGFVEGGGGGGWEEVGGQAGGGTGGGEVGGLAGPVLDAEEVEDSETAGEAGPGGVRGSDLLQANEAGEGAGAGRSQE